MNLIKLFVVLIVPIFFSIRTMGQNLPPIANPDGYTTFLNGTLTVTGANGLLSNDSDPDGGFLLVKPTPVSGPTNGILTLNSDGSFSFVPQNGNSADVFFEYKVCDDGIANELVSQFDFNAIPLTKATVGPNATTINPNAVQTDCGIRIGSGSGGNAGLDIVVPNTSGIFNFTSFAIDFEYRDQEGTADIISGGNFRIYHISADALGLRINIINGATGMPTIITRNLGNFGPGLSEYSVVYSEISGEIIYTINGVTSVFSVAPAFSPLNMGLAGNVTIGRFMDNSGTALPSLCSISITDSSSLCSLAEVVIRTNTSVITNKRITYRVNKN